MQVDACFLHYRQPCYCRAAGPQGCSCQAPPTEAARCSTRWRRRGDHAAWCVRLAGPASCSWRKPRGLCAVQSVFQRLLNCNAGLWLWCRHSEEARRVCRRGCQGLGGAVPRGARRRHGGATHLLAAGARQLPPAVLHFRQPAAAKSRSEARCLADSLLSCVLLRCLLAAAVARATGLRRGPRAERGGGGRWGGGCTEGGAGRAGAGGAAQQPRAAPSRRGRWLRWARQRHASNAMGNPSPVRACVEPGKADPHPFSPLGYRRGWRTTGAAPRRPPGPSAPTTLSCGTRWAGRAGSGQQADAGQGDREPAGLSCCAAHRHNHSQRPRPCAPRSSLLPGRTAVVPPPPALPLCPGR